MAKIILNFFFFLLFLQVCYCRRCFMSPCRNRYPVQQRTLPMTAPKNINISKLSPKPGYCNPSEFVCSKPYAYKYTALFECYFDNQCPQAFKCCANKCFSHKVCQKTLPFPVHTLPLVPSPEPWTDLKPTIDKSSVEEKIMEEITKPIEITEPIKETTEMKTVTTPEATTTETTETTAETTTEASPEVENELNNLPSDEDSIATTTSVTTTVESTETTEEESSESESNMMFKSLDGSDDYHQNFI